MVPMLPFACLALAWAVDDRRTLVRAAFAVLLGVGVALSSLYVVTGVREYHTLLTYPIGNLYLPVLSTGYVPHVSGYGPTPLNLATYYLGIKLPESMYIVLIPLAIWTISIGLKLIDWQPRPSAHSADSSQ